MTMLTKSRYKPARGGHAPGDVREAFLNGLDAVMYDREEHPTVELRERKVPMADVCGLLWNCTDTLPGDYCRSLSDLLDDDCRIGSYAQAARAVKAYLAEAS
jgi:hypothetical protein